MNNDDMEMSDKDKNRESIGNTTEDTGFTLLDMLMRSAGEDSLFISWEPGRINQYYFLTTK